MWAQAAPLQLGLLSIDAGLLRPDGASGRQAVPFQPALLSVEVVLLQGFGAFVPGQGSSDFKP